MANKRKAVKFLAAAFATAVVGASIIPGVYHAADRVMALRSSPVVLTAGEQALAKSIFGGQIDPTIIRKHYLSPDPDHALQTFGRNINIYGPLYFMPDHSTGGTLFDFRGFAHELAHVWQNQTQSVYYRLYNGCKEYGYALLPQSRFGDFCVEQQASIVGDYAATFLRPGAGPAPDSEGNRLLAKIVEDQFPQARVTRLALKEKELLQFKPVP